MKYAYYPGCSVQSSARMYERTFQKVMRMLHVELVPIPGWTCCGATSAHVLPPETAAALSARNLVWAEKQGLDVVTGCAACYFRLSYARNHMASDSDFASFVNRLIPEPYTAGNRVLSVLDILSERLRADEPLPEIKRRMTHLKAACYYGCLFVRPPGVDDYHLRENPETMEQCLNAAGIETVAWSYKTDCCGASAVMTRPETARKLIADIIEDARLSGAVAIVTACPMCQMNLDITQKDTSTGNGDALPVFFVTQLLGAAWGIPDADLGIHRLVAGSRYAMETIT